MITWIDPVALADRLEHLPAVDVRHHHIEEDQVRLLFLESRQPLFGAPGFTDRVAVHLQVDPHELADSRVVIDDQDERRRA